MKNIPARGSGKNKKIFFVLRLFLLLPFLMAVFLFGKNCLAKENSIIINEIMIEKEHESKYEFIELYNTLDVAIDLSGYKLTKKASIGTESNLVSSSKFSGLIPEHGYFLITHPNYETTFSADLVYSGTSYSISKNNTIILYDNDGSVLDKVGFGVTKDYETFPYPNPEGNQSIERENFQDTGNNLEDFNILNTPTPTNSSHGKDEEPNEKDEEKDPIEGKEPEDYTGRIKINEIKADTSDEFVEVINTSEGISPDFTKWCIKDEIKYKKTSWNCKNPSRVERNDNFFTLYGKFSLNNTSAGDTVYLYDEDKKLVDKESYTKAKKGFYYAFDGSNWRWTSQPTPGEKNIFDKILSGKIEIDERIYKDIYAAFEVDAKKEVEKFTWDFGDGHKSYLKKTRHKYEKSGEYNASLRLRGKGEEKTYFFEVKVEKYKAPEVRILALSPNPKGNDSKNEWIEIQNKSKKKINLQGWSVATGWENLYNHPIHTDFILKPGKIKKLTRDVCAFSLANTKTKIELRSPDRKTVQKIKYNREEDKIRENEVYRKLDDTWKWIGGIKKIVAHKKEDEVIRIPSVTENINREDLSSNLGKYSQNPLWQKKKAYRVKLASSVSSIGLPQEILKRQSQILGAEDIKIFENHYSLTKVSPQKHWAIKFIKTIWTKLNFFINLFFLSF